MAYIQSSDPVTGKPFFANPTTGECSWDLPEDATLVPRNQDDSAEWWELHDTERNVPYYVNSLTKETVYEKPDSQFILPLAASQDSEVGKEVAQHYGFVNASEQKQQQQQDEEVQDEDQNEDAESSISGELIDEEEEKNYTTEPVNAEVVVGSQSSLLQQQKISTPSTSSLSAIPAETTTAATTAETATETAQPQVEPVAEVEPISAAIIGHGKEFSSISSKSKYGTIGKPKRAAPPPPALPKFVADLKTVGESGTGATPVTSDAVFNTSTKTLQLKIAPVADADKGALAKAARANGISGPVLNPDATFAMSPVNAGATSTTTNRSLPIDLKEDLQRFRIDGFANKYFAEHKKGLLFKRKVPIQKMLEYQKAPLSSPLLQQIAKPLHKEATKSFKIIQKIMKTDIKTSVDDIHSLMEKGVLHGGIRDEIYVQICKQVTKNPSLEQTQRGWFLIGIIAIAYPPSHNFEDYLKNFISSNLENEDATIAKYAQFAQKTVSKICKKGPRGKTPSKQEIERAIDAPFTNQLFGETLEDIMSAEHEVDASVKIPRILPFLAESIINLQGCKTEGIFRVPGDIDAVMDLRCRVEKSEFNIDNISDPNVPSSLLKLWLRELTDPLIPQERYDECIKVGLSQEPIEVTGPKALDIIDTLPDVNREVCYYVIRFLRTVAEPVNQTITKMTVANIAMVFAPNFVRCPSDSPAVIFENTKYEQSFLRILMTHVPESQEKKEKLLSDWELKDQ